MIVVSANFLFQKTNGKPATVFCRDKRSARRAHKRPFANRYHYIAIAAVLCGEESWYDIEAFGKAKYDWLKKFLKLPNGIPTHDTFNRFFASFNLDELAKCFLEWTQSVSLLTKGEVISID